MVRDVGVRGLDEMRDVYLGGESEQFVLAVEHGELASIAGREFPDGQLGPRAIGHLELPDRKQRRGGAARPVPLTHHPCSRDPPVHSVIISSSLRGCRTDQGLTASTGGAGRPDTDGLEPTSFPKNAGAEGPAAKGPYGPVVHTADGV
jgi:hypothetical protein